MIYVIKKDGTKEEFNVQKVVVAVVISFNISPPFCLEYLWRTS